MSDQKLLGTLYELDGRGVVRMEDTYATDIDDLWAAITEPDRLARWIAVVRGDLRVGGEFSATFTSSWDGQGRVEVCDAPRHLVVTTWEGDDDGDDGRTSAHPTTAHPTSAHPTTAHPTTMEATLTSEGERTRLVIEERGLPLEQYQFHGSGWQAHVEDLASYLAGKTPSDWVQRWRELTPAYEALVAR